MAVVVEIQQLVAPLRYYSERILDEGNDNEETTDGRKIATHDSVSWGSIGACGKGTASTYGLSGSLMVSIKSSILLVCCLMASSGPASGFSSLDPPKGFCAPMP